MKYTDCNFSLFQYIYIYHIGSSGLVKCNIFACWCLDNLHTMTLNTLTFYSTFSLIKILHQSEPFVGSLFEDLGYLVVLFEISTICFGCFQDPWLFPQTNTKLFSMFCPHSYAFRETFQKVTHLITTSS